MKVKECIGCKYRKQITWTSSYKPVNYHAVGTKHVYNFCTKHNKRVIEIKKCEVPNDNNSN